MVSIHADYEAGKWWQAWVCVCVCCCHKITYGSFSGTVSLSSKNGMTRHIFSTNMRGSDTELIASKRREILHRKCLLFFLSNILHSEIKIFYTKYVVFAYSIYVVLALPYGWNPPQRPVLRSFDVFFLWACTKPWWRHQMETFSA